MHREVFTYMFKYKIHSLFFAYLKESVLLNNLFFFFNCSWHTMWYLECIFWKFCIDRSYLPGCLHQSCGILGVVSVISLWCERNVYSLAFITVCKIHENLSLCVFVCVFLFFEERNVHFLLKLSQSHKMDSVLIWSSWLQL